MADFALLWGSDLSIDETGDFLTVNGNDELVQRVVRRALTNAYIASGSALVPSPADYVFDANYGGNIRSYVDALANNQIADAIQTRLLDQIQRETAISSTQPPVISVVLDPSGVVYINASIPLADGSVILIPQLEVA